MQTQIGTQADRNMALALLEAGDLNAAENTARRLTRVLPRDSFGWKILGAVFAARGNWEAALSLYRRALPGSEHDWEFLNNYANALKTTGRLEESVRVYQASSRINPRALQPQYNQGLALIELGRLAEAEQALLKALMLEPLHGLAHLNLGNVYNVQNRLQEAELHYRGALLTLVNEPRLHNNLGLCLRRQHRYAEAEAYLRRALEIDPEYVPALSNLADFMATHGFMEAAVELLRHALQLNPEHGEAWSNLLFTLSHTSVSPEDLLAEHLSFAAIFDRAPVLEAEAPEACSQTGSASSFTSEGDVLSSPLGMKIGFVSGDLCDHPMVRYLRPALEQFRKDPSLELYAYNNNTKQDGETAMYRSQFHYWRNIAHLDDGALAKLIEEDGVDVLIDLSGHSGHNRLPLFARRPAPLQISWMGYVGSTGMSCIDYFIADELLLPRAMEDQFVERILRVPVTTTFQPYAVLPEVNSLPALMAGVFTFSCLARMNKLNRELVAAWAQILRRTPCSRLMLVTMPDGRPPYPVLNWFESEGMDVARLRFVNPRSTEAILALHHEIDLALDTFPYNGSTSNNHALTMGVPTLTCSGKTPSGRMTTCLNLLNGLDEFVTFSVQEYVDRAVAVTQQLPRLAAIRATSRERFAASPLQQHALAAQSLVAAFRQALKEKRNALRL